MSKITSIQWSDSTANPGMGCTGCELWPTPRQLRRCARAYLRAAQSQLNVASLEQIEEAISSIDWRNATDVYHCRFTLAEQLLAAALPQPPSKVAIEAFARSFASLIAATRGFCICVADATSPNRRKKGTAVMRPRLKR